MIYIFAVIGVVAVVALLWRAFDVQGHALTNARHDRATVPPDDDPDFLRRLGEQRPKPNDGGDSNES